MIRTIISLGETDKAWVEKEASERGISLAALIRLAISQFKEKSSASSFDNLLKRTTGIWDEGDGLVYQTELRSDWDR